jgi:tRNA-2-methylthio-N6-dimethylallyladenosine synthase
MVHLKMKKSVFIYTYGCQMNVHDSEKMLGTLEHSGYVAAASPDQADLIIFNTCAIRAKAEQKFFSQLGRTKQMKKRNPGVRIAVAGCVAQDSRSRIFKRAPYVDYILGPQNIHQVKDLPPGGERHVFVGDNPGIASEEYEMVRESRTRAWVSIMYGCNNFCSYCIVPYTRGREVSRPSSSILAEIRDLQKKGYREITLLGQNVNSYRSDMDFVRLLHEINSSGIERVRFVTSHPRDLSTALISAMAELPAVCEHLHLPLQSGADKVLSMMNRKYTYAVYREKVMKIREKIPGISITTDIIVGFPGETDSDYEHTRKAVEELGFDGMFAFKFSKRKGTRAYEMVGQVPEDIKTERINDLLKVQEDISLRRNKALEGTVQEILVEGPSDTDSSMLMGRTRSNKIVTIDDQGEQEGAFLSVLIEKARHHSLSARRLQS